MGVLNETIGKVVFNCSRDTLNLVTLGSWYFGNWLRIRRRKARKRRQDFGRRKSSARRPKAPEKILPSFWEPLLAWRRVGLPDPAGQLLMLAMQVCASG